MTARSGLAKFVERCQSFLFVPGQQYVARESEHLKQLSCLVVYVRKNELGLILLGNINDAQQN